MAKTVGQQRGSGLFHHRHYCQFDYLVNGGNGIGEHGAGKADGLVTRKKLTLGSGEDDFVLGFYVLQVLVVEVVEVILQVGQDLGVILNGRGLSFSVVDFGHSKSEMKLKNSSPALIAIISLPD